MKKRLLAGAVVIIILIFGIASRFVSFDGGLIFGEPDEFVHKAVVQSLLESSVPKYRGEGFFFEMPAYFASAGFISKITSWGVLFSLRYLSFVSLVLSAVLLAYYLKVKENWVVGLVAFLVFLLIPLGVFYLRVGVIEPFLVLGLTGSIVFYDLGRERRSLLYSALSGIFLGLALLTKYSILPLLAALGVLFIIDLWRSNRNIINLSHLRLPLGSFLPLFLAAIIFLPIFIYYYATNSAVVKWQTLQVLGQYGGVKQELRLERLLEFSWWFSWPVVILTVLGFWVAIKNWRRYYFWLFLFGLFMVAILTRLPYYPRYGLVLLPFFAIFSALALGSFFRNRRKLAVLGSILVVVNLPSLVNSWQSAEQNIFNDSIQKIKGETRGPNYWVLGNFWPNYFGEVLGVSKYGWLTYDLNDFRAFGSEGGGEELFKLLKKEGAFIFLEGRYADFYLTQPKGRILARQDLTQSYSPRWVLNTSQGNFPFFRSGGNQIKIYEIKTL